MPTWLFKDANLTFMVFFALASLWYIGVVLASIVYRRRPGKAIIPFADIISLSLRKGIFVQVLDLHFRAGNGESRHFDLRFPDAPLLIEAVRNR